MTEEHDPLEAELHSLRPHDVSLELQRRIAKRLTDVSSASLGYKPRWRLAIVGGCLAACLTAVALLWPDRHKIDEPSSRAGGPPLVATTVVENNRPATLQMYRRALAESPEALETLLDKQAALSAASDSSSPCWRAFTWSPADLFN